MLYNVTMLCYTMLNIEKNRQKISQKIDQILNENKKLHNQAKSPKIQEIQARIRQNHK